MWNIIIQIGFFCPCYQGTERGDLSFILKFFCQVPLCCFYSFSPFRLLSRNTCICSKCLSLYIFTMMVREIGRSFSPGKNHISRGLRPRAIWFFWGYKSSYFPNVHAIIWLFCRTRWLLLQYCLYHTSGSNCISTILKKKKRRECLPLFFLTLFSHFPIIQIN